MKRASSFPTLVALLLLCTPLAAQEHPLGTLREQAEIQQEWLRLRLEQVLPRLMREHDVQMWIMPSREYNEDPVFFSIVSPTTQAARRRTIYVFCDRGEERGVERIAIGGTTQGGLYRVVRDPAAQVGTAGTERRAAEPFGPEQWRLLTPIVEECDPRSIQVNISHTHAFSDGITAGEWQQMQEAIPARYRDRVVHRDLLPLQYIEERLPEMLPKYVEMQRIVHDIIQTAFSNQVITPGVTRTQDVVWWMRQRVNDLGLGDWFQPSVSVQRRGVEMGDSANPVIQRGDVLHTDFGISALGLNTDTQHMGYVLRQGETDAPAGLKAALRNSNRLQDILLEEMEVGRTGNEVLRRTLERMRAEGLNGTMYTHPIGDHGHGAGPLIGLWDRQEGVPGRGEVPLRPNTWFSTELQVTTPVPEWGGQPVRMAQEEEARIDAEGRRHWVLGRQTEFHLVR
ncbi:MAG TPA: M24 family metallopeptidase [Longimicrobiaceae bacterium]|nr:M24 family metallopeptidase [Longimicrobiaceae bacterium]